MPSICVLRPRRKADAGPLAGRFARSTLALADHRRQICAAALKAAKNETQGMSMAAMRIDCAIRAAAADGNRTPQHRQDNHSCALQAVRNGPLCRLQRFIPAQGVTP
jgi:hypothetical protein